ncbi:hypothetical protein IEQ34_004156 [Dendrobium chrysotoxum]|uniref:Histone acetyltransferase n=1 Tax=Dendrobium chrysotoxum TaxID=161865 RepID=A0AAV7HFU5_DENCH|nr:hypothetical protein IEQ34_004156 [Dendrobium chrysotoxum]
MPRPGPRPYECVRRAWHSDRHQPMRGSLIQEIFRLANEVHCNATRKNKEWQDKLPFVVLKAEEIMYSKANSEAEYMDLKTLWDRANDAIDTIIRKDDANESGDLLQPCIEAALNLGCIPRRASRSQRHSNPVCYLSPNSKEATDVSQKPQDNKKAGQICPKSMLPPLLPMQSGNLHGSTTQFGSKYSTAGPEVQFMPSSALKGQNQYFEIQNKDMACKVRGLPMPMESGIWPELGCVYPLYYGEGHSTSTSQSPSYMKPQEQMVKNIFSATKPSVQSNATVFIVGTMSDGLDRVPDCNRLRKLAHNTECDLSLRLGLPSPPSSEVESSWAHEVEDVGSNSSCDGGKSCGPLPNGAGTMSLESSLSSARDKGFDFFSVDNTDEHYESCSSALTGTLSDECFNWK